MAAGKVEFIDCTSLSISYDVMGIATVNYTVVSNESGLKSYNSIKAGDVTFDGYVSSAIVSRIPNTSWYESRITLISTSK